MPIKINYLLNLNNLYKYLSLYKKLFLYKILINKYISKDFKIDKNKNFSFYLIII